MTMLFEHFRVSKRLNLELFGVCLEVKTFEYDRLGSVVIAYFKAKFEVSDWAFNFELFF